MKNIAPAWTFVIAPAIVFGVLQAQQTIPATPPAPPTLMLADAEHMAIEHNPRISVARLLQLAQAQVTREVRSGELPAAAASLTAVDSHNGSRITAGALNNPIVYERAAGGLTVSQLITDFGRTHNLILSAQSQAKAQLDTERATTEDIVLAVDQAFYSALTSQAVLKVAEETVAARQATADQISALSAAKLRSTLDLSFANVELSQARLLLLDAQNAAQSSMANLNALLGSEQDEQYALVDQAPENPSRLRSTRSQWSRRPSVIGPTSPPSTTATTQPDNSAPPNMPWAGQLSPHSRQWAGHRSERIRFFPRGMEPRAPA